MPLLPIVVGGRKSDSFVKHETKNTIANKKKLHYFQTQNSAHLSISWVEVLQVHVHQTEDETTVHKRETFLQTHYPMKENAEISNTPLINHGCKKLTQ